MSSEIKPCPFCEGEPAPLDENYHTSCTNVACGSTAYMHVDAWNNRPAMKAYARIEELEAELGGWSPIATAPKDGTHIDLWGINHLHYAKKGERIVNVKWGPVTNWMGSERDDWQHGRGEDFEPTHWMPLPTPPSTTPDQERAQTQHPSNRVIASFDDDGDGAGEQSIADAHLIAAAPDLLEALKAIMSPGMNGPESLPIWKKAEAAIAKAEGGAA